MLEISEGLAFEGVRLASVPAFGSRARAAPDGIIL
jgi:hypothetical protein